MAEYLLPAWLLAECSLHPNQGQTQGNQQPKDHQQDRQAAYAQQRREQVTQEASLKPQGDQTARATQAARATQKKPYLTGCVCDAHHENMKNQNKNMRKRMGKRLRRRAGFIQQLVRTSRQKALLSSFNGSVVAFACRQDMPDQPDQPDQLKYICALKKRICPDVFNKVLASTVRLLVEIDVEHALCGWCACDLREVCSITACRLGGELQTKQL